jgi:hypothetical protein
MDPYNDMFHYNMRPRRRQIWRHIHLTKLSFGMKNGILCSSNVATHLAPENRSKNTTKHPYLKVHFYVLVK